MITFACDAGQGPGLRVGSRLLPGPFQVQAAGPAVEPVQPPEFRP